MTTRKIYGTQYDDTITVTQNSVSVATNTTKTKKAALQIYDVSDFDTGIFAGDGNDKVLITGTSNDAVDGGTGDDLIFGGLGNDLLSGGGGKDTIYGGSGDDIVGAVRPGTVPGTVTDYQIDPNSDQIGDLLIGDGFDPINVAGGLQSATPGNDILVGGNGKDVIWGDNGPGDNLNGGNDQIFGGNGDDSLNGQGGNDRIKGENGNDSIDGGSGDDTIDGGYGADIMKGGAGADAFVYNSALDSTALAMDTIVDFSRESGDKIDLRPLLGLTDLGWGGDKAKAYGVWLQASGANTLIRVDTSGDALADMVIQLNGLFNLRNADFLGVKNTAPTLDPVDGITYNDTAADDIFLVSTGMLKGTDGDANDVVTYKLAGGTISNQVGFDIQKGDTFGTLFLNTSTGAHKFVPNDGAIEALKTTTTMNFSVSAYDGLAESISRTITVTFIGVNDAPRGEPEPTLPDGKENTPYTLSISTLMQDISDAENDPLSVVNLTADHGSITDNGNGTWTLMPDSNDSEPVKLSYQVSDGNGGSLAIQKFITLTPYVVYEFKVNTTTLSQQMDPSISGLADGGWITTWKSYAQDGNGYGVFSQRYEASGKLAGGEVLVNSTTIDDQLDVVVTALNDGGWVATWVSIVDSNNGDEIMQQRYDLNGDKIGGEINVNTISQNNQTRPSIAALIDGGWIISWESDLQDSSGFGIYQQRYDKDGNAVGIETLVNTNTINDQSDPAVTALTDGGWVTAWTSNGQSGNDYDIYLQRFDKEGNPVGGEVRVNTTTESDQDTLAITSLDDGGWVTAWGSFHQDTNDYDIYLQRYDKDGTAVQAETQVNTATADNQDFPAISTLADGGWVIAWKSSVQDSSGDGVYQQRYDKDGHAVGGETLVNSTTTDDQSSPIITALADGGWVTSWMSSDQDGSGWGIYQQRYDKDGNPVAMPLEGNDFANSLVWTGTGPVALDGAGGDDFLTGGADNDILIGGSGNDILIGLGGSDTLTGSDGSDRFVFKASDGPGNDSITDFSAALPANSGDVLDLSNLLVGYVTDTSNLTDFVLSHESSGNTIISVDRDGSGTDYAPADIMTLVGVITINLNTLLTNGNLVLA